MRIGERIRAFGQLLFDGQKGWGKMFAQAMGVKPPTLHPYFRNEKKPGGLVLERLIKLGCNADWLLTGKGDMFAENESGKRLRNQHPELMPKKQRRALVPVMLEPVPAGNPVSMEGEIAEWVDAREYLIGNSDTVFITYAKGDSMIDAGIQDGDALIVDPNLRAQNGEIVVAIYEGQSTVKRLHKSNGHVSLVPENKKYKPIVIENGDLHIAGVVVSVFRTLRRR